VMEPSPNKPDKDVVATLTVRLPQTQSR